MDALQRANFVRDRMEERQAQGFSRIEAHSYAIAMLAQAEANEPEAIPAPGTLHIYAPVPDGWPDAHILVDFYERMQVSTEGWEQAAWEELDDGDWRFETDDDSPVSKAWLGIIAGKQFVIRMGWLGKGSDDDWYEYEEVEEVTT